MDRQLLRIWTDNHLEYGQRTTRDMDKQPLGVWTANHSGYRQKTTQGYGQTTIHYTNSHKLTGCGQTTTQDIDKKTPKSLDREPLGIWTDYHSRY